jgi:hypothetical protein
MGKAKNRYWIISVLMGLGHLRAAMPLKDMAPERFILYGSRKATPPDEYRTWKKIRKAYYFLSTAETIPVLGIFFRKLLSKIEKIEPFYPMKDNSKPTLAVKYLSSLIKRKSYCAMLKKRIEQDKLPMVHTFYATAMAMDQATASRRNYLLICDADFNRVWVPPAPASSQIKYLAPCTQVKDRLLTYGVNPDNIYLTGFPLPKENIGSEKKMEILKADLFLRLIRLDPARKFFAYHQKSVMHWLDQASIPRTNPKSFRLMFAIGGAGAQVNMVEKILFSLKEKIDQGSIKIYLSAGINQRVFQRLLGFVNSLGMERFLDEKIFIIYHYRVEEYIKSLNRALRITDVLWTKPSEMSFYCALGIPIILAPYIGPHEKLNRRWLHEIHAAIQPPGPLEYTHQWLFDLREKGRLAEAAWDGFLKARKLGTYKIEKLVTTGQFQESNNPLEQ